MRKITIGVTIFVVLTAVACLVAVKVMDKAYQLTAVIISINGDYVIVEPVEGETISTDRIGFSKKKLDDIGAAAGDTVAIKHKGYVLEIYPGQIEAVSWKMVKKKPMSVLFAPSDTPLPSC